MLHNLQHNALLQQLTINNTAPQCTGISEEDPNLSIMGAILVQTPFFRNIKRYRYVIQSDNYKTL